MGGHSTYARTVTRKYQAGIRTVGGTDRLNVAGIQSRMCPQGLGREGQASWRFELGFEGEFRGKEGEGKAKLVCSAQSPDACITSPLPLF